jgi:hypothetical protein
VISLALNAKSEKVFNSLMQALLQFLKGLYALGIVMDDTAVVIGDEDIGFVIHTTEYRDETEDDTIH